jgi:hypothetical protein
MPICVVDQLEMINVNNEQGYGLARCTGRLDRCRGGFDKSAPQRQLREVIDPDGEYLGMTRAAREAGLRA